MDYEKKYKEALKKAKSIYRDAKEAGCSHTDWLEHIFPQLTESEDERIRKQLVDIVAFIPEANFKSASREDCRTYLEKQKEQKPSWSEDFGKEVESVHKRYPEVSFAKLTRIAYHFAKWADKYKSTEWREEDEKNLELVTDCVYEFYPDPVMKYKLKDWLTQRLKSLRPQPQHRDTYYDIIHNILDMLKGMDFMKITPEHRVSLLNDIRVKCKNADECAAILDEPSWKPSKKQMKALHNFSTGLFIGEEDYDAIRSLYEDLKKL